MKQRNRQSMAKRVGKRLAPARRRSQRRGVLLLAVLSILVLFLLVGTTFLITSGQYRTASKVQEKAVRTTFQPADVLERALMQLLRDTNNPSSVVRYHSLLRDLYGVDGFVGRSAESTFWSDKSVAPIQQNITSAIVLPHYAGATKQSLGTEPLGPTNGQLIEFYVYDDPTVSRLDPKDRNTVGLDFDAQGLPVDHQLPTADGYYNGCVLTFIGGPCRGSSVRIVDYDHVQTTWQGDSNNGISIPVAKFRIVAPSRSDGRPLTLNGDGVLTDLVDVDPIDGSTHGHRFIVNGRPFNGTGVGFNPLALSHDLEQSAPSPRLSAIEAVRTSDTGSGQKRYGFEVALTPNATQYNRSQIAHLKSNRFRDPFAEGLTFDQANPTDPASDYVYLNSDPANAFAELATPRYGNFAGPGDTDESYDAPDSQNMALALQSPEPRLRGRVVDANGISSDPDAYFLASGNTAPAYLDLDGVTIPSFHRPALANFWFHRLYNSGWLSGIGATDRVRLILEPYNADGTSRVGDDQTSAQVAAIKRKFLMRPLREDHPDFDGSNALSRYGTETIRAALDGGALVNQRGTPGDTLDDEITFPFWEAVGPWDVDNDGDGVPDSVWVDVGLPVQKTEDGRWYKPLVAMLVEDLDGRLNLNAHGSLDDLASLDQLESENLDASVLDSTPDDPTTDNVSTPWIANLAQDYANSGPLYTSDQLPSGEGWGPAEVSLRSILSPGLPLAGLTNQTVNAPATQSFEGNPQFDDYARLLAGRPDPALASRTVENALRVAEPFGRYGSAPSDLAFGALNGVELYQPGRSYSTQAGLANQALRDATVDPLTVYESVGAPEYTFSSADPVTPVDLPNGYSSPPNQRARYAIGLSAAGAPVSEATNAVNLLRNQAIADGVIPATDPLLAWRQDVKNTPNDSPYELNLSPESRRLLPVSIAAIRSSYDTNGDGAVDANAAPLNDDAPFSAAELERLLRALDADAPALPDRLWNLVDAFDPIKLAAATRLERLISLPTSPPLPLPDPSSITSLDAVAAAAKAAINRRSVTTDSWDLPVPNENWSERLTLGADGLPGVPWGDSNFDGDRFNASPGNNDATVADNDDQGDDDDDGLFDEGDEVIVGYDASGEHTFSTGVTASYADLFDAGCDDYVVVMRRDPPASPRITDYLRYRITLELLRKGVVLFADIDSPLKRPVVERHLDEILVGSNIRPASLVRGRSSADGIDDTGIAGTDMVLRPALFSFGGLLAPELLAGHRMDLNRPFGDGRDNGNGRDDDGNGLIDDPAEMGNGIDDNGNGQIDEPGEPNPNPFDPILNGIVDEPGEAGEPAVDRNQNGTIDPGEYLDWNRNGVYDEPRDILWASDLNDDGDLYDAGETTPFNYTAGADANGRGAFINAPIEGTYTNQPLIIDDGRSARQLMARHLYCLMLSLMDEHYLAPYDPNDLQVQRFIDPDITDGFAAALHKELDPTDLNDPVPPPEWYTIAPRGGLTGNPKVDARRIAMRKLTCRMVAQWAINVVDFRDPDAIQTPFEYDENPWDGWNVVDSNGTLNPSDDTVYPLDNDLTTDETARQVRDVDSNIDLVTTWINPDDTTPNDAIRSTDQTRGVVWGAERPEALLAEGLAMHDRRLVDAVIDIAGNGAPYDDPTTSDGGTVASDQDDDLDQVIRPKGLTYLELLNPWKDGLQRPAELYSHVDQNGVRTIEPGIRFDRLSDTEYPVNPLPPSGAVRSPVWRIVCIEEDSRLRNATQPTGGTKRFYLTDDSAGDPNEARWPSTLDSSFQSLFDPQTALNRGARPIYAERIEERDAMHRAALRTTAGNITAGAADFDGLVVSLGVREAPLTIPDPDFPLLDPFDQPQQVFQAGNVKVEPVVITSGIEAGQGTLSLDRLTFEKPLRYFERFAYMVTPYGADGGSLPYPNVDTSADPNLPYDPSGYRIPKNRYVVETTTPSEWASDDPWRFGVDARSLAAASNKFRISPNRFAAFDWFDIDSDNDRIEALAFAPVLPGRRAIAGTQGNVYEVYDDTELEENAAFFAAGANDPLDRVHRFATGRFTTVFSDPLKDGVTLSRNPIVRSDFTSLGRFEMIPSPDHERHQFGARMNGSTESLSAFDRIPTPDAPNGVSRNLTIAGALPTAAVRAGDPVVAIPIDNFSISEPLDRYLRRVIELDVAGNRQANFDQLDLYSSRIGADDVYRRAEGVFTRALGNNQVGFDEPFDVLPELIKNQTTPNYRSVHLQRLANPLLPWNPEPYVWRPSVSNAGGLSTLNSSSQTRVLVPEHDPNLPVNPYVAVDSLPLDLHAFNSHAQEDAIPQAGIGATQNYGPEVLHKEPRPVTSRGDFRGGTYTQSTASPFAPVSNERGHPWGSYRSLWRATLGRLLWQQPKPSTTTELVLGTEQLIGTLGGGADPDTYRFGETHIHADVEPYSELPFEPITTSGKARADAIGNGFDLEYELAQMGYLDPTVAGYTYNASLANRIYQAGWRMTLGFGSPWMGRQFMGSGLSWRRVGGTLASPEQIDLDGDGSASDLIGSAEILTSAIDLFADTNANGRPDVIEGLNFDPTGDPAVEDDVTYKAVDSHTVAENPYRDVSTTPEFHWPNRPFASAGELLQVPAWGGTRMLTHFSGFNWMHTQGPEFWHHTQINPYNGEAAVMHDGRDFAQDGTGAFNGNFADDEPAADRRDGDNYLDVRATNELRFREMLGHFGHLTNFFQTARHPAFVQSANETIFVANGGLSGGTTAVPEVTQIPRGAAHFYRLLDYVHVPTPFTASKTLLNPEVFGEDNLEPGDARAGLSAPFNSLGTYREPGRVNLNTIVGRRDRGADPSAAFDWWSEVYDGLMHRTQDTSLLEFTNGELLKMGHLGPAWRDVALSRRGYVQSTFDPNQNPTDTALTLATAAQNRLDYSPRRMHPDFPTFFANPFRAPGEGANVPLAHMVQTGVDATLLRAHPLSPGADGAWGRRGIDDQTVDKGGSEDPPLPDGDLIRDDASEAGAVMLELGGGGETVPVPDQPTVDQLNADVVLARFRHSREELRGHADGRILRRGALPDSLLQDALRPNLAHYHDPRQVAPGPSVTLDPLQLPPVKLLPSEDGSEFESPDTAFANTEIGRRVTPVPLFSGATIEPSLDTERNATKRFQPIQRMSSLATTRSNVYAVWITVGFFEVKPASEDARIWPRYMTDADGDGIGDTFGSTLYPTPAQAELSFLQVYPEGWTLGKELGFDTGTNERHRGFYMVDRSRPVAFRPGEDANVSDAVLVRRRLE